MGKSDADMNRLYVRQLDIQKQILLAISNLTVSAPPGSGLATEITLETVSTTLAALLAETISGTSQEIEILLVRDTVTLEIFQQITDYTTGSAVISYKDVNGNIQSQPLPNNIEYLDLSAVMNLVLASIQAQGLVPQATETTLAAVAVSVDAIDSVNQDILTEVENIDNKIDVPLSDIAPKANTLSSVKTTAGGTIPLGSKAASIFIDGVGATVNNVERPDGWSQSFEFNNNTLPAIPYNGNNTATVYVDILT